MPKFSVVISVYNKEALVKETIQSVLQQSVQDFEIIIVNDASTDNSEAVIQNISSPKITYIPLLKNTGAGAARNVGITATKGEYIALLDGDDLWDVNYLAEIITLITVFPQHHVFATAVLKEHKHTTTANQYSFENPKGNTLLDLNYFESSYKNTLLTSSSTVIHRSVFDHIGFYDEQLRNSEDIDLWIRLGLVYPIAFSTNYYATFRFANQSLHKSALSVTCFSDFRTYLSMENENTSLKKFIDLNRYSLVIRARLWNEPNEVSKYLNHLNLENLNSKQRFLIGLPTPLLKIAFRTQAVLEKMGLKVSTF